ncbi:hypothetical protein KY289_037655 [Solanum tuberosum]|nr:hypothetical protein KY289_037655 [Solanum tuberosum]
MRCDLMMGRWEWLVIVHSINFPWKRWSRFAVNKQMSSIQASEQEYGSDTPNKKPLRIFFFFYPGGRVS